MNTPTFELSNEQRAYLGLEPVEAHWERVSLFDKYYYFDGDIIRKEISVGEQGYTERSLHEKTAENRSILLPKTSKGKSKKLNFTASQSFKGIGAYFSFWNEYLTLSNYTTQTSFYSEQLPNQKLEDLPLWLEQWIADTTPQELEAIRQFSQAHRQHCKYAEGDFFAFKIGRKQWGFGRILLDVQKQIKTNKIKRDEHFGLTNLMGKCLLVKVYHKISDTPTLDLHALAQTPALPSQIIMDNHFYYGQNPLIGHLPLQTQEYDMLISYSKSISSDSPRIVYLQYGMLFRTLDIEVFDRYLLHEDDSLYLGYEENPYRKESSGFGLDTASLEDCIKAQSNLPYWQSETAKYDTQFDLRNPANLAIKRDIFKAFGLDADQTYTENLHLAANE
ncbi:immunity 26/phosphotriesterase HocA family protein [Myroides sp. C15-4]|uniref:immunity 26/phosphotriesterase HocA family protein n=1 Tax=Myroides sp. C15-4 TaxID=3400532 RepID=UPI003D2F7C11